MHAPFQLKDFPMSENTSNVSLTANKSTHTRQDWTSARFVEESITIQVVYGTRYAAAFLKNRMIDIDVALRVLLNPAQRRNNLSA